MNTHLVYESLLFANRDTLDACMLASRVLKDMIGFSKRLDVLRPIIVSVLECNGTFNVYIDREGDKEDRHGFSRSDVPESEWPELVSRIDNGYVLNLKTCWSCSRFLGFFANFVERAARPVKFRIGKLTHESVSICQRRNDDPGEHFAHQVTKVLQVTKFDLKDNPYLDSVHRPLEHPSILSSIEELRLNVFEAEIPRRLLHFLSSCSVLQRCYLDTMTCWRGSLAAARWVNAYIREFQEAPGSRNTVPLLTIRAAFHKNHAEDLSKHIPEVCERPVKAPIPPGPTQRLLDLYRYLSYGKEQSTSELFTFRSISGGKQLQVFIWQVTIGRFPSVIYHCVIQ